MKNDNKKKLLAVEGTARSVLWVCLRSQVAPLRCLFILDSHKGI